MKKQFNLSRIFKQRDKLIQALRPYIDKNIIGDTFKDLTADVYQALPPRVSRDAVFETCRSLAGAVLDRKDAGAFSWRLAGNAELLRDGIPVISWTRQVSDEWMPVQVLQVDPARQRGKPGVLFQCRALAGSYCPGVFEQFLSRASCSAISRVVGFSNARPYISSVHFTNLRFLVFIEAHRSTESLHFQNIACSPSMQAYNHQIIAIRTRVSPCPQLFAHLCEHCALGCTDCPAAIFQQALVKQHCNNCELDSFFDIDRSVDLCLSCWQSRQLAHHVTGS
jgi:hypothetical protein